MSKDKINENEQKVDEILTKRVGEFADPQGVFREKLIKKIKGEYKKDIIIKFGIDPTRPDIHLGHAVVFKKLRQLQDLGCKVIFLVGDFTARIGDPSGKDKIRPEIELKEIEKNTRSFIDHIDKILKVERDSKGELNLESSIFSWIRNSDWFYGIIDIILPQDKIFNWELENADKKKVKISLRGNTFVNKALWYQFRAMQVKDLRIQREIQGQTINTLFFTLKHITFDRLRKRDMFEKRNSEGKPLYMHEMLYPVLQGIDSVVLSKIYGSCDLEIGGTDQTFNMLMGRDVMVANKLKPQAVMALKILEGTDGIKKMSKSLDNYIAITDTPNDMYGKIMSIPDTSIINYFELCTFRSLHDISKTKKLLESQKVNPRDVKMELAHEIVAIYHGKDKTEMAEKSFTETFSKGGIPEDATKIEVQKGTPLYDAVSSVVGSKMEFKRLIHHGAVTQVGGEKIMSIDMIIENDMTVKIGKRRFVRIKIK